MILHSKPPLHLFSYRLIAGRVDPTQCIRARQLKEDEKKAELATQRKNTKESRAKRLIPLDPDVPPCAQGLVYAIHAFVEAQDRPNGCS